MDLRATGALQLQKWGNALSPYVDKAKRQVMKHPRWWIGGVSAIAVTTVVIRYIRSLPEKPTVTSRFGIDRVTGQIRIEVPPRHRPPLQVTFTVCLDASASMDNHGRKQAVIEGLQSVAARIQRVLREQPGAKVALAAVAFNKIAQVILEPTDIQKGHQTTWIEQYQPSGSTRIRAGLKLAASKLQEMQRIWPTARHTLLLLSDGDEELDASTLPRVPGATLRAVGIGAGHNSTLLKSIDPEYIDTTQEGQTICGAIEHCFEQALASFTQLRLSSPLPANSWTFRKTASTASSDGASQVMVADIQEGTPLQGQVTIFCSRLKKRYDLSQLGFTLHFTDPRGTPGTITVPVQVKGVVSPVQALE